MANVTLSQVLPSCYFFVAQDSKLPNGGALLDDRLSRPIKRKGVLQRVLKRVCRTNPTAYGVEIRCR